MSFPDTEDVWDFTPVIDLNYSLSSQQEVYSTDDFASSASSEELLTPTSESNSNEIERELGNLDRVWEFLGVSSDALPPVLSPLTDGTVTGIVGAANALDDPLDLFASKNVRWRDELGNAEIADDIDKVSGQSIAQLWKAWKEIPKATKRNKKQKKKKKEKTKSKYQDNACPASPSSSEPESGLPTATAIPTRTRSSVIHEILHGVTSRGSTPMLKIGLANKSPLNSSETAVSAAPTHRYPLRSGIKAQEYLEAQKPSFEDTATSWKLIIDAPKPPKTPVSSPERIATKPRSIIKAYEAPKTQLSSAEEIATRRTRLIAKLTDRFSSERSLLERLDLPSMTENVKVGPAHGLHVFIDASNVRIVLHALCLALLTGQQIMIGLHDAFKISRGLSIASRIRRQPISFRNLSIVLERGRLTAKRVLVGSDNFPSIQEAKRIGYETNILDRVHKAKELTPRQMKYRNVNGAMSSGSETTAVTYAPEKWVEQAVDEILHLKILESVVDAEEPSTIVLATGDAAEAEYSQGFLKMVERALGKGWKVEVCSFRKNISGSYRKKEFRTRWGTNFKIIEMDDFVQELLDVEE